MRLRPYIVAFSLMCWALTGATLASAQEGRMQETDPTAVKETSRNEPDPILSSESESRNSKTLPAVVKESPRDSVQAPLKIAKPSKAAEKDEKEEDPLSFNFLYYIIGKFKLNDIIE